jgi:hypothetical protein
MIEVSWLTASGLSLIFIFNTPIVAVRHVEQGFQVDAQSSVSTTCTLLSSVDNGGDNRTSRALDNVVVDRQSVTVSILFEQGKTVSTECNLYRYNSFFL